MDKMNEVFVRIAIQYYADNKDLFIGIAEYSALCDSIIYILKY